MQIEQLSWTQHGGWALSGPSPGDVLEPVESVSRLKDAHLVLIFGGVSSLQQSKWQKFIEARYPNATCFGASTAGEIRDICVQDESIVATAIRFKQTEIATAKCDLEPASDEYTAGRTLAQTLSGSDLAHVLVLCAGHEINASELLRGLRATLPADVNVSGGLAGGGMRFEQTLVFCDGPPQERHVALLGLYGSAIRVGCGSLGGWDPFGPERLITRSNENILYELDGKPALELYKRYLGEHAKGLPATGLLFPLVVRSGGEGARSLTRTILGIDEENQSLIFAGAMPEGSVAQLMMANFDRLIDGAIGAAKESFDVLETFPKTDIEARHNSPDLAILISCFGRRLVLQQRIEEELEGVRHVLGSDTVLTGFYSYGEICPAAPNATCELHNQTMTVTALWER